MSPPLPKFDEKTSDFFGQKWPFQEVKIFVFFGRLPLGFGEGKWTVTVRDPRRPGDQVGGHTQERPRSLPVITVPVTRNVEDMIINIEGHASSVSTDTECVFDRALSDRDWSEPELRTLPSFSSEPGTR